jgi:nucleotide-binding universal stress UspA family protein
VTVSGPKPRLVVGYDGSELAKAAVRGAAELFPGSPAAVVTVWEPGLGAMAQVGGGMDVGGAASLPPDPELVSEIDHAEEHHAAVVAREGAELARSLGLDAEAHPIPDQLDVADTIVDVASKHDAAAVVIGSHGTSGLRSRLLGTTSRRVLARCRRPVVVIRLPSLPNHAYEPPSEETDSDQDHDDPDDGTDEEERRKDR